ncbi:hypothetical protein JL721_11322 [Aureococcus anophagefferens]|nr:hypothetical protein JL721_11322 [Aureococcus anophagefferens]
MTALFRSAFVHNYTGEGMDEMAPAAQAAAPPSPASLELVQRALDASSQEQKDAVPLLGKAIEAWKKEKLMDDEPPPLLPRKRTSEGDAQAEADLAAEVTPQGQQRRRSRRAAARSRREEGAARARRARDAKAALALDDLPNLKQRNPFSYELLRARRRATATSAAARTLWYEFEADGAGQAGEDYSPRGDAKLLSSLPEATVESSSSAPAAWRARGGCPAAAAALRGGDARSSRVKSTTPPPGAEATPPRRQPRASDAAA